MIKTRILFWRSRWWSGYKSCTTIAVEGNRRYVTYCLPIKKEVKQVTDYRRNPRLNNDKIQADYERYNAAARAFIASGRARALRDDPNRKSKYWGKLDSDTIDKGKVFTAILKEIVAVEMKDATDRGKPLDERTARVEAEWRVYERALRMLFEDELQAK